MASESTASTGNVKVMPELSILTILIQAAVAINNGDGDTSLHGYMDIHGQKSRRVMESEVEVEFAVLDSLGDILLQNHQVLAISPSKQEKTSITVVVNTDFDMPAENPINGAAKVSSISATIVPNPNDRTTGKRREGRIGKRKEGPLKEDPVE